MGGATGWWVVGGARGNGGLWAGLEGRGQWAGRRGRRAGGLQGGEIWLILYLRE